MLESWRLEVRLMLNASDALATKYILSRLQMVQRFYYCFFGIFVTAEKEADRVQ
jgi:hypothetical protein